MKSPFTHEEIDTQNIIIETLYSADKDRGFVGISWGDKAVQLTPEEARAHSLILLEAAAIAEQDEVTMRWLREYAGVELHEAAHMLTDLRNMRKEKGERTN